MQAVWLENNTLDVREIARPARPGEALIKIRKAGICSTDLELVKGYYPYTGVLGHEFVGEVVESPNNIWVGQRVVGEINAVCGECEACRAERSSHCENRTVLGIANRDGVFAEYANLPLNNLYLVPSSVSDDAAMFTEPLAAALEIQEQVSFQLGDRVLVIGAGRLGQLIAQSLQLTGVDLKVLVRNPRAKQLLETRGIVVVDEMQVAPQKFDVVVEVTGSAEGFNLARRAIRPRGIIVLKSTYAGGMNINMSSIVVDEVTLLGSRCGPFEPALRLMEKGEVDPTVLLEAQYKFKDALAAFEHAARPGVFKVSLES